MELLSTLEVRRLALARAGLLKPDWTGFPRAARGRGEAARRAALAVIARFGYLQLDTISIAGVRSHALVLLSRLEGFAAGLAEELLQPGEPLFEYWAHEASWIPVELYPVFEFRRRAFRTHPWWGDVIGRHPQLAEGLLRRIRDEGPLRSRDMEGRGGRGWWDLKLAKKVATALWSSGELAIRERSRFERSYDLSERVIPERWRGPGLEQPAALERLMGLGLAGHGWATTGTLEQTFRLRRSRPEVDAALGRLVERGEIARCSLVGDDGTRSAGWVRREDLELADRLRRVRPGGATGVLLSPFDPLLWDRRRVAQLFGFDQRLEVFKPASQRAYGYYCLPVLAGEQLVARVDLKADRKAGRLGVLSRRFEGAASAAAREAVRTALARYCLALGLELDDGVARRGRLTGLSSNRGGTRRPVRRPAAPGP